MLPPQELTKGKTWDVSAQSPDSRSNPTDSESRKDKIWLGLVVAVLSFFGAAGGTLIPARLEKAKWDREISYNINREILVKRIELLERSVKVVNQANAARARQAH